MGSPAVSDTWIGKTVDHYRITEKLGQGGSGQVFRGVDLSLNRPVAIKVLRPDLALDPALAERFRGEAQTLARLNHPNIATLYRLLWQQDLHLMVMEYVKGDTLDELIQRHGPMTPQQALPLVLQALEGIHHAHQLGIVHRDIKGSNVMRSQSSLVKVMDFGIARALGSNGLTQEGKPVGTPEYMSPEQIRGEEIDARSDIYSLGILLFKLLSGRVPFAGKSQYEVMRDHMEGEPLSLCELVPELEDAVERIVLRALAKSPEARFASIPELRAALEEAIPLGSDSPSTPSSVDTRPPAERGTVEEEGTLDSDTTEVPRFPGGSEALADCGVPDCDARERVDASVAGEGPTSIVADEDPNVAPVAFQADARRLRLGRFLVGAVSGVALVAILAAALFDRPRAPSETDSSGQAPSSAPPLSLSAPEGSEASSARLDPEPPAVRATATPTLTAGNGSAARPEPSVASHARPRTGPKRNATAHGSADAPRRSTLGVDEASEKWVIRRR
jgi:serine/threonine-protein kinase